MNFDKRLFSTKQAVISISVGLLVLFPFSYTIESQLKYPVILLLTMIMLSAIAELLPRGKKSLSRGLRIISFVLAIIVLVLTFIFIINKFMATFV